MTGKRRVWLEIRCPGTPELHLAVRDLAVRIGRGGANQVDLRDALASQAHAEIVERDGQLDVRDLGSTNGTWLNGTRLEPGTRCTLKDGDILEIGASVLTYRSSPDAQGTAVPDAGDRARPHRWDAADEPPSVQKQPAVSASPSPGAYLTLPDPDPPGLGPAGRFLLVALFAVVAVAALSAAAAWQLAPSRVSVLVLGSDARPKDIRSGDVGRTDTLMTVVADRSPPSLVLISLPRDLWVTIPGFGEERINAAFRVGGSEAAKRVTGDILGVPVDRHLLIGLQGVRDIVDAAGGVDIEVDEPILDPEYPDDDDGVIEVNIPAGRHHMDGEMALRYARSRRQGDDFGRVLRQQRVVMGMRRALLQPPNWWRLPAVVEATGRATQTDLGPLDLLSIGRAALTSPVEPGRLVIDLTLVESVKSPVGAEVLRATPQVRREVAAVLSTGNAAVEVLNATQTEGLAKQTADKLRRRGLRVARTSDAGRYQSATAIEAKPGLKRAGLFVAAVLDLPADIVLERPNLPAGVDVRLTLGDGRPAR